MRIVEESAKLLNSTLETLAAIRTEMDKLSSTLPEYETVMSLYGVGRVMCSQLIAEIGDIRRFEHSKSLVAMAGIAPPPDQSGQFDPNSRSICLLTFHSRSPIKKAPNKTHCKKLPSYPAALHT